MEYLSIGDESDKLENEAILRTLVQKSQMQKQQQAESDMQDNVDIAPIHRRRRGVLITKNDI